MGSRVCVGWACAARRNASKGQCQVVLANLTCTARMQRRGGRTCAVCTVTQALLIEHWRV
jgi:hypothetical protein